MSSGHQGGGGGGRAPVPMRKSALRKGSKQRAASAAATAVLPPSNTTATTKSAVTSRSARAAPKVGLFVDNSGSTIGQAAYWGRVAEIVVEAKGKYGEDGIIPCFWNTFCTQSSSWHQFMSDISFGRGGGGTDPSCIESVLDNANIDRIILVTDGQINQTFVQNFDDVLERRARKHGPLTSVDGHCVGHEMYMNMSVVVPLIRRTKFTVYKNRIVHTKGDSSRNIAWVSDYCGSIEAMNKFLADKDELAAIVYAQNIGKYNEALIDTLARVRKDLLLQVRRKKDAERDGEGGASDPFGDVKERLMRLGVSSLRDSELDEIFGAVAAICNQSVETDDDSDTVNAYIDKMLEHCSGKANYGFQETHVASTTTSNRLRRADADADADTDANADRLTELCDGLEVKSSSGVNAASAKTKDQIHAYYRDIRKGAVCRDLAAVLQIVDGPSLFFDCMSKSEQEFYLTNPWALAADSKFRRAVRDRARIDGCINGTPAIDEIACGIIGVPMAPFDSPSFNTPDYDGAARHPFSQATSQAQIRQVVSALFFKEGVVSGNPAVWFAVIYLCLLDVNTPSSAVNAYGAMVVRLLELTRTNITLSGNITEPNIETDVNFALWYCAHTPWIMPETNRLRQMRQGWPMMKHLLKKAGYPCHPMVDSLMILYDAYAAMLGMAKRAQTAGSPKGAWMIPIRALWQNSITVKLYTDSAPITLLLDGEAAPQRSRHMCSMLDLRIQKLASDVGVLWALAQLVDPSTKEEGVDIPLEMAAQMATQNGAPRPPCVQSYGYPTSSEDAAKVGRCTIHPNTFRPCTFDRIQNRHWEECAQDYGRYTVPLSKQLSVYNYFIEYVTTQNKYPTKNELLFYMYCRESKRESCPKETLPRDVVHFVDEAFEAYETVLGPDFANVDVSRFIETTKRSMNKVNRARMEEAGTSGFDETITITVRRVNYSDPTGGIAFAC